MSSLYVGSVSCRIKIAFRRRTVFRRFHTSGKCESRIGRVSASIFVNVAVSFYPPAKSIFPRYVDHVRSNLARFNRASIIISKKSFERVSAAARNHNAAFLRAAPIILFLSRAMGFSRANRRYK